MPWDTTLVSVWHQFLNPLPPCWNFQHILLESIPYFFPHQLALTKMSLAPSHHWCHALLVLSHWYASYSSQIYQHNLIYMGAWWHMYHRLVITQPIKHPWTGPTGLSVIRRWPHTVRPTQWAGEEVCTKIWAHFTMVLWAHIWNLVKKMFDSNYLIWSQFCTGHDSWAVMAGAILWPDLIINCLSRSAYIYIYFLKLGLWTREPFNSESIGTGHGKAISVMQQDWYWKTNTQIHIN